MTEFASQSKQRKAPAEGARRAQHMESHYNTDTQHVLEERLALQARDVLGYEVAVIDASEALAELASDAWENC